MRIRIQNVAHRTDYVENIMLCLGMGGVVGKWASLSLLLYSIYNAKSHQSYICLFVNNIRIIANEV